MNPAYTQTVRVESVVSSDELAHRIQTAPNINDKIAAQKLWLRQKMMEADVERKKAAMKQKWAERVAAAAAEMSSSKSNSSKKNSTTSTTAKLQSTTTTSKSAALTTTSEKVESPKDEDVEEEEDMVDEDDDEENEAANDASTIDVSAYREQILDIKERKFLKLRNPGHFHHEVSPFARKR